MSGSTIGGVVGFAVGSFVGYPQLGYMLGSMIGGAVDPEKIRAPDGRDAQEQTTTDGIPIPVVFGRPPPFMGTVLDGERKARRIKGKYRSAGKGGPKVQDPDKYIWTGAILICEGPIAGLAFVVRNGVIVADWREEPKIPPAETAKFASKMRLYLGTEDQLPDPALEAMHGVDDTPYYRGRAYIVIVDDDVTDTGGSIAKYAFGVVKSGQTQTVTQSEYSAPMLSRFVSSSDWPLLDQPSDYEYVGYHGAYSGTITGESPEAIIAVLASAIGVEMRQYLGYSATTSTTYAPSIGLVIEALGVSNVVEQPQVEDNQALVLVYNAYRPDIVRDEVLMPDACDYTPPGTYVQSRRGKVSTRFSSTPPAPWSLDDVCSPSGQVSGLYPLCIRVTRKPVVSSYVYGDPCDLEVPVRLPDAPGYTIDCAGVVDVIPSVSAVPSGTFRRLSVGVTATVDGRTQYVSYPLGPVIGSDDPDYGSQSFWESAYAAALEAGEAIAEDLVYGTDYPVTATASAHPVVLRQFSLTTITSDQVFLREVQEELARRCDVPPDRIDASELSVEVIPGYMVAAAATGANCSRPLQTQFFYDMPEVDGAIRCSRRGKPSVGTLTADDFVEIEEDDEDIRSQQVEFPKAIHLAYPDPALNYAITKQTFAREAAAVISVDEEIVSSTIPFDGDTAAKVVDIMGKAAWAAAEGRMKCTLPREFTLWTPGDDFDYAGKRWHIVRAEYDSYATIKLDAVYDRISNWTSIASGKSPRAPGAQTSGLRGPTRLETINLSPLLDAHDKLGLYFGVCGILEGWAGGVVSASIDDGATYTTLGTWRDASVMGHTTTALPAGSPWVFDPTATVTVKVHGGDLDSATFLQLLNEANACVLGDEAVQYAEAVEVDEYTFQLTGLTRARHGTSVAAHPIHSRFALLDDTLNFVELQSSWIGRTITLHVQSVGTPGGTGYTETFVWHPAAALTEWVPVQFTATEIADGVRLGWIGRGRLGSTASPFHSGFFDGYRVTLTDGVLSKSYDTTEQNFDYTDAQRTADFGSLDPLGVSISGLNRITGLGPALTGTI